MRTLSQKTTAPLSRREMLARSAFGMGTLALASLLADNGALAATKGTHFRPRAKRVLFLFMDGGVSQVDSFDPKPRLTAEDGQPFKMTIEATQFDQNGRTMGSPFTFQKYGESGMQVSSLFPHIATCVDDLCLVRSMQSPFAEHSQSCLLLHTGHPLQGRPSLGAWLSYGLGSECDNLPGYVVLSGGQLPLGGLQNYGSGFLPAMHAGSLFHVGAGTPIVDNIVPAEPERKMQAAKLRLLAQGDREFAAATGSGETAIESAIRNYELAFAMQTSVPEATDLADETQATLDAYGVTSKNTFQARYARQCLLARRLLERGVRFVELTSVAGLRNVSPWDSHSNLKVEHQKNADVVDQPIAALLKDLKARGLLDDTLVVWAGEFGRTPFAQGSNGRDHNPQGFTIWLTGAGLKRGIIHGATDEYGYHAVEKIVTPHDLQATILHLLGLDHEKLTFRYSGRDFRLTDVDGRVVSDWLA